MEQLVAARWYNPYVHISYTIGNEGRKHDADTGLSQITRTSNLEAPLMELTGHSGEIFSARFNPTGELIASGSMDRSICKVLSVSFFTLLTNEHRSALEIFGRM